MKLEHSFKRAGITIVGLVALLSMAAAAQEIRSEISVQGSGFFTKNSQGNGVQNHAEDTGGFLVGYRYNINRWLAAEANYGYDRNTQTYFGSTLASVQSNVHQITGSAVVKMPGIRRIPRFQPYALAGGGALVFDPTGKAGTFPGATRRPEEHSCTGAGRTMFSPATGRSGRVSRFRLQGTELQSSRPEHEQLDACCSTISRHRVSLLASRQRHERKSLP